MSPDVYIENLCRRKDIHWREDRQGGYVATVNGASLRLYKWVNNIFLAIYKGDDETVIGQPTIHISLSPIGKFFREKTLEWLGFTWPGMPRTSKEMENERLRLALDSLYLKVAGEQET